VVSFKNLLEELNERTIAQRVGIPHDEARMNYPLTKNTVRTFEEFNGILGDYVNHHIAKCISNGGNISLAEASSRGKEILEAEYRRRRNGDIVLAYNDARDGTNGGLRACLDVIAERLKAESVERYVRDVFDRHIRPSSWEDKLGIIRQFIDQCGHYLGSSIRGDQPERYAQNYQDLIRTYTAALENTSSIFRRL
jgi:hypothetical protein